DPWGPASPPLEQPRLLASVDLGVRSCLDKRPRLGHAKPPWPGMPAESASTAAATSPVCPAPTTTASTSPPAALLLLGGIGVLLFGDHRQPPGALTIARRHPRQLHAVRYPAQWPGDRDLGHLDTASAGNVAEPHGDPRLGGRAHLRQQHQFLTGHAPLDDSLIIDHRRPGPDGMQDARSRRRPVRTDGADPAVPDDPS